MSFYATLTIVYVLTSGGTYTETTESTDDVECFDTAVDAYHKSLDGQTYNNANKAIKPGKVMFSCKDLDTGKTFDPTKKILLRADWVLERKIADMASVTTFEVVDSRQECSNVANKLWNEYYVSDFYYTIDPLHLPNDGELRVNRIKDLGIQCWEGLAQGKSIKLMPGISEKTKQNRAKHKANKYGKTIYYPKLSSTDQRLNLQFISGYEWWGKPAEGYELFKYNKEYPTVKDCEKDSVLCVLTYNDSSQTGKWSDSLQTSYNYSVPPAVDGKIPSRLEPPIQTAARPEPAKQQTAQAQRPAGNRGWYINSYSQEPVKQSDTVKPTYDNGYFAEFAQYYPSCAQNYNSGIPLADKCNEKSELVRQGYATLAECKARVTKAQKELKYFSSCQCLTVEQQTNVTGGIDTLWTPVWQIKGMK